MIIEEGECETKIRPRKIMPYTAAGGVGIPEMVRRISNSGDRFEAFCLSVNSA